MGPDSGHEPMVPAVDGGGAADRHGAGPSIATPPQIALAVAVSAATHTDAVVSERAGVVMGSVLGGAVATGVARVVVTVVEQTPTLRPTLQSSAQRRPGNAFLVLRA